MHWFPMSALWNPGFTNIKLRLKSFQDFDEGDLHIFKWVVVFIRWNRTFKWMLKQKILEWLVVLAWCIACLVTVIENHILNKAVWCISAPFQMILLISHKGLNAGKSVKTWHMSHKTWYIANKVQLGNKLIYQSLGASMKPAWKACHSIMQRHIRNCAAKQDKCLWRMIPNECIMETDRTRKHNQQVVLYQISFASVHAS